MSHLLYFTFPFITTQSSCLLLACVGSPSSQFVYVTGVPSVHSKYIWTLRSFSPIHNSSDEPNRMSIGKNDTPLDADEQGEMQFLWRMSKVQALCYWSSTTSATAYLRRTIFSKANLLAINVTLEFNNGISVSSTHTWIKICPLFLACCSELFPVNYSSSPQKVKGFFNSEKGHYASSLINQSGGNEKNEMSFMPAFTNLMCWLGLMGIGKASKLRRNAIWIWWLPYYCSYPLNYLFSLDQASYEHPMGCEAEPLLQTLTSGHVKYISMQKQISSV